MDEYLNKYTNQQKKKAPNSPAGEQIEIATKITGKDWGQIAGLTRHLSVDQFYLLNKESQGRPQFWWTLYKQKYALNSMEAIVKEKLETVPAFRERKDRGIYLAILALRELNLEKKQKAGIMMTMNELSRFGVKYDSYRNAWDTVMRKNEHLQGTDYAEGKALEERVLKQKGYR